MYERLDEKYYRYIFEKCLDAILLTNSDGKIYRANRAACDMLQRAEEDICHIGRLGIVDLNDSRVEQALKDRLQKGQVRAEFNLVRKDGTVFPADVTSATFEDGEGLKWTVIIIRDISEMTLVRETLRKAREDSEYFASTDYLTGILNRRTFIQRLEAETNRAFREKTLLSLCMIDIDFFKKINDTMGHQFGDDVLKSFALSLKKKMRPYDFCGRYGGDEFVACFPSTNYKQGLKIAERIRKGIENEKFGSKTDPINLTVSVGVECYDPCSDEDLDALIIKADKNMYKAKYRRNYVYGILDESKDI